MNNAKYKHQNYYDDQAAAIGAIEWFVERLNKDLAKCLNVTDGACDLGWKHEGCILLMNILYDITGEERYMSEWAEYWG